MGCVALEGYRKLTYTYTVPSVFWRKMMSFKIKRVRASIALSIVHSLLAKGELGRVLRTIGMAVVIANSKDKFPIILDGYRPLITFVIKFEAKNDKLGAVLVGIKPSDMPPGLVPQRSGAWLLFEPIKGSDYEWGADSLAIDPAFPAEAEINERDWKFYAKLALDLGGKR